MSAPPPPPFFKAWKPAFVERGRFVPFEAPFAALLPLFAVVLLVPDFLFWFVAFTAVAATSTFPLAMDAFCCSKHLLLFAARTGAFCPTTFNACSVKKNPEWPFDPRSLFPLVGPGLHPAGMFGL